MIDRENSWPAKRSWFVIWQPQDAKQYDPSSVRVIDIWSIGGPAAQTKARDAAYEELNRRIGGYIAEFGHGKISLLEGDLCAHFLYEKAA